jgi:hypothetical protein
LETSKPWYLSRTIWASMITVLAATAGLMGFFIGDADQAILTDSVLQVVTGLAGIAAIVARLSAKDRIG